MDRWIIQVKKNDGLDQDDLSGSGEKQSDSVYALKVEPTKFADGLDMVDLKVSVKGVCMCSCLEGTYALGNVFFLPS